MTIPQLSWPQLSFLAVLEVFQQPIPTETAANLSEIPLGDLLSLLRNPEFKDYLKESADQTITLSPGFPSAIKSRLHQLNDKQWLDGILQKIKMEGLQKNLPSSAYQRLLTRCGRVEESARLLFDEATTYIQEECYQKALLSLSDCLEILTTSSSWTRYPELYISATVSISGLVFGSNEYTPRLLRYINRAMELAEQTGDQRSLAMLNLYQVWFSYGQEMTDASLKSIQVGLNIAWELGDEEILAQSAAFSGYYYMTQGLFKQASDSFEQAFLLDQSGTKRILGIQFYFPSFYANAAAFSGEFHRAIGILKNAMNNSTFQAGHRLYRSILGTDLIMMGKWQDGRYHLQQAFSKSRQEEDNLATIWSKRGMAYYYFLTGEMEKSFAELSQCLSLAKIHSIPRTLIDFPWILEMVYGFDNLGYKAIPGNDLETCLSDLEKGVNTQLRGVVYRIRARQAAERGDDPEQISALYQKSVTELIQANGKVELAKTHAEMASFFLGQKNRRRARKEALIAWRNWPHDNRTAFPQQPRSIIQPDIKRERNSKRHHEILSKYIRMTNDFFQSEQRATTLFQILVATSRFFESEQAGIFSRTATDKNQVRFDKGYFLAKDEVCHRSFKQCQDIITRAMQENRPKTKIIPLKPSATGVRRTLEILCLPLKPAHSQQYLLYFSNTYSRGYYQFLSNELLLQMSEYLGHYLDRIERLYKNIKEKSRLAIVNSVDDKSIEEQMISTHPIMRTLLSRADQAAESDAAVLIQGETGVGKELLARYIHEKSPRQSMPFIAVNLASIPENLLESELFGYEKGAFTGATHRKPGLIEVADKGTLFIDEVGDIPGSIQVKLLRVLQEKTFIRVGGIQQRPSDFRIIAATNREMMEEVANGNFREDLFYRLNVIPLRIPPLRQRGQDVLNLARYFLKHFAITYSKPIPSLSDDQIEWLTSYTWPGNIRELRNIMERAIILSTRGQLELFISPLSGFKPLSDTLQSTTDPASIFDDLPTLDEIQRRYITRVLTATGGKISGPDGAAELLGLKRPTLYSKMKKLGIEL